MSSNSVDSDVHWPSQHSADAHYCVNTATWATSWISIFNLIQNDAVSTTANLILLELLLGFLQQNNLKQ